MGVQKLKYWKSKCEKGTPGSKKRAWSSKIDSKKVADEEEQKTSCDYLD
jgi:hypothetical protein